VISSLIVLAFLMSVISNSDAQPTPNLTGSVRCSKSSNQPSEPISMDSVITSDPDIAPKFNFIHTIHSEKETFDCRPIEPSQPGFKMSTQIVTHLEAPPSSPPAFFFFKAITCRINLEGIVNACSTTPITIVTSNLTHCSREKPVNGSAQISSGAIEDGIAQNSKYNGISIMSETQQYKCISGNIQFPNKIKVVTLFTVVRAPAHLGFPNPKYDLFETSCVRDIRSASVNSCEIRHIPNASGITNGPNIGGGGSVLP
jgi:hypothetical protein